MEEVEDDQLGVRPRVALEVVGEQGRLDDGLVEAVGAAAFFR